NVELPAMLAAHQRHQADATLLLHPTDHPYDSDLVLVDGPWVTGFAGKPERGKPFVNLTNAGLYIINRRIVGCLPAQGDFCRDVFPEALAQGLRLHAYVTDEFIKDMGTPERLRAVEAQWSARLQNASN
ncbi:D,D-heptose 1,7-bisphosphate phosphatase, partial [Candidatus Woesearchaeota archaeon CG_4_10_14_0_2_um_filter_57_5]